MKLIFSAHAWADYQFWLEGDSRGIRRIDELIRDAQRSPFKGIGKPEPLVGPLKGSPGQISGRQGAVMAGLVPAIHAVQSP